MNSIIPRLGRANRSQMKNQKRSMARLAMKSFRGQVPTRMKSLDQSVSRKIADALESSLRRTPSTRRVPSDMKLKRDPTNIRNYKSSSIFTAASSSVASCSSSRPSQDGLEINEEQSESFPDSVHMDDETLHRLCNSTASMLGLEIPNGLAGGINADTNNRDSLQMDEATLHFLCREAAEMLGLRVSSDEDSVSSDASSSWEQFTEEEPVGDTTTTHDENKNEETIEISTGVSLPLHGSEETQLAILEGNTVTTTCLSCQENVTCVKQADWVVCPDCCTFSPNEHAQEDKNGDSPQNSVGLGVKDDMVQILLLAEAAGHCSMT